MLKIENDQIIDLSNLPIEMSKLTCAICYCLLIHPKRCSNRKCSKAFCSECIKTAVANEPCCPFCRLTIDEVEFINCNSNLSFILSNMKVICTQLQCASKTFKIESYFHHLKSKTTEDKCNKCGSFISKDLKKCSGSGCKIISCKDCNLLTLCTHCGNNLCKNCETQKEHLQLENILIEFQEKNSIQEKVELNYASCYCCNIKTSNLLNLNEQAIIKCEKCKKNFCKNFPCEIFKNNKTKSNCLKNHTIDSIEKEINQTSTCIHKSYLDCNSCIPKCCYTNIVGFIPCSSCDKFSCNSSYCVSKCHMCNKIICKDCFVTCKLCKTDVCKTCCIKCDNCNFSIDNSFCCLKCSKGIGSSLIKRCSFVNEDQTQCDAKLCLNCWKACNACSTILCQNHSIKCVGCEESCCNLHLFNCEYCDYSEVKGKVCLKNCTRRCEVCVSVSTAFCNKGSHPIVEDLKCQHSICSSCTRKCSICYEKKGVVGFCSICQGNKITYCRYCKKDYCNSCIKYCCFCNEHYCPFNKCVNCNETVRRCLNCLLFDSQVYCEECHEDFNVCETCSGQLICSLFCYVEYKKKVDHLCTMFNCEKCTSMKKEKNQIVKMIMKNFRHDSDAYIDDSSSIQDRFIESEPNMNSSSMSESNPFGPTLRSFRRRNYYAEDKVSAGCTDSCACNIY
jgi:hypothetical protein